MAEKVLQWLQRDVASVRDFRIEMLTEKVRECFVFK